MTDELKNIFDQFANLIERWNAKEIPNEGELIDQTRRLAATLRAALAKPQPEQTTIDDGKFETPEKTPEEGK